MKKNVFKDYFGNFDHQDAMPEAVCYSCWRAAATTANADDKITDEFITDRLLEYYKKVRGDCTVGARCHLRRLVSNFDKIDDHIVLQVKKEDKDS